MAKSKTQKKNKLKRETPVAFISKQKDGTYNVGRFEGLSQEQAQYLAMGYQEATAGIALELLQVVMGLVRQDELLKAELKDSFPETEED